MNTRALENAHADTVSPTKVFLRDDFACGTEADAVSPLDERYFGRAEERVVGCMGGHHHNHAPLGKAADLGKHPGLIAIV